MNQIIPLLDFVKDDPWFTPLIAALVILAAITFMTKMIMMALSNTRSIHSIVNAALPAKKSLKTLALAEEAADRELDILASDYGADRAYLMLFHNGKTSLANVHMLSASVKAEGGSGRFPKVASRIQGIPLKTYGSIKSELITNNDVELVHCSTQAPEKAPEASLLLEQNSVKSLYVYPLSTPTGDIDGGLFFEYCQSERELGEKEQGAIKSRGQAIYSKLHEANNV